MKIREVLEERWDEPTSWAQSKPDEIALSIYPSDKPLPLTENTYCAASLLAPCDPEEAFMMVLYAAWCCQEWQTLGSAWRSPEHKQRALTILGYGSG